MDELKRYKSDDLSGVVRTVLALSIGGVILIIPPAFENMTKIGTVYGVIWLIGAIGVIAANALILAVDMR